MALRYSAHLALACALAMSAYSGASAAAAAEETPSSPLTLVSGRVSLSGTSNIHAYTAATTEVRIVRARLAPGVIGQAAWDAIVRPGILEAFEIAIPAATLASPKGDIDKNMHKALQVKTHPEITFRLLRLEPRTGVAAALRGIGMLQVAGVEREVTIELTTERKDATLAVHGQLQILMTDYGIKAPVAMLGMLKTDPAVTVTFDVVLATPLT